MSDDQKQRPAPAPARPNTDDTFKKVQESGGQKPRPTGQKPRPSGKK